MAETRRRRHEGMPSMVKTRQGDAPLRFIGSKAQLLTFIQDTIVRHCAAQDVTVGDLFCGTVGEKDMETKTDKSVVEGPPEFQRDAMADHREGCQGTGTGHPPIEEISMKTGKRKSDVGGQPATSTARSASGTVEIVEVDAIDIDPVHARAGYTELADAEADAVLERSVASLGVLVPPLARRDKKTGRIRIVAGARRFKAARAAGHRTLTVIIRDMSDFEARAASLASNIWLDLPQWAIAEEMAGILAEARKEGLIDGTRAAAVSFLREQFGLPEATICGYLDVHELERTWPEAYRILKHLSFYCTSFEKTLFEQTVQITQGTASLSTTPSSTS